MNKHIYIDGSFLTVQTTGIQRFSREIIKELDQIISDDDYYYLVVPNLSQIDSQYNRIHLVEHHGLFGGYLWSILSFPAYVRKQHGFAVNLCNRPTLGVDGLTCLHDVIYRTKVLPSRTLKEIVQHVWNRLNYWLIAHNSNIVTVSEFTASEIKKYYPCTRNKNIPVIHNAWQHMNRIEEDLTVFDRYPQLTKGNYYFSMSSIAKNKNFEWILRTATNNPKDMFVVAGGGNLQALAKTLKLDINDNVLYLGYVSDAEAKALMHKCEAFIFPSLYEGFGVPPLEAVASGAPSIILSDIPCLREIYGEYSSYINPHRYCLPNNDELIGNQITDLLEKYSWHKSASDLYDGLTLYQK